jgi:AcrR family transcriptional regulator
MSEENTRNKILDGFADQLLEWGYRGVSLRHVTDAVGIQRPSLYHHFPKGKEQLYTEVALRMIEADVSRLQEALATPGGLRDILRALALLHTDDPRKVALDQRIYDATRYVSDKTRTAVSTRYVEGLLQPVETLMAEAVASGELRDIDPGLLTSTFFGMTNAVQGIPEDVGMPPNERETSRLSDEQVATQAVDLFLNGANKAGT